MAASSHDNVMTQVTQAPAIEQLRQTQHRIGRWRAASTQLCHAREATQRLAVGYDEERMQTVYTVGRGCGGEEVGEGSGQQGRIYRRLSPSTKGPYLAWQHAE